MRLRWSDACILNKLPFKKIQNSHKNFQSCKENKFFWNMFNNKILFQSFFKISCLIQCVTWHIFVIVISDWKLFLCQTFFSSFHINATVTPQLWIVVKMTSEVLSITRMVHPKILVFWSPLTSIVCFPYIEVNGHQQLFGYQHSLKYLLLCSTEEINS